MYRQCIETQWKDCVNTHNFKHKKDWQTLGSNHEFEFDKLWTQLEQHYTI